MQSENYSASISDNKQEGLVLVTILSFWNIFPITDLTNCFIVSYTVVHKIKPNNNLLLVIISSDIPTLNFPNKQAS